MKLVRNLIHFLKNIDVRRRTRKTTRAGSVNCSFKWNLNRILMARDPLKTSHCLRGHLFLICAVFASYLDGNQAGDWANSEDRVKLTTRPAMLSSV